MMYMYMKINKSFLNKINHQNKSLLYNSVEVLIFFSGFFMHAIASIAFTTAMIILHLILVFNYVYFGLP